MVVFVVTWKSVGATGMPDVFAVVRKLLPGSYTMILPASKAMPKVILDGGKHRQKQRRTVGVRMPAHPVTQGLLQALDRYVQVLFRVQAAVVPEKAHK